MEPWWHYLLEMIFSCTVAVSTVVYAVLTNRLVKETEDTRRFYTTPHLVLTLEPSEESNQFVYISIHNAGPGIARDITFSFSTPDGETAKLLLADFRTTPFLDKGISILGANRSRHSHPTDMLRDFDDKIQSSLQCTCTYHSIENREFVEEYLLDFAELKGHCDIRDSSRDVVGALNRIDRTPFFGPR